MSYELFFCFRVLYAYTDMYVRMYLHTYMYVQCECQKKAGNFLYITSQFFMCYMYVYRIHKYVYMNTDRLGKVQVRFTFGMVTYCDIFINFGNLNYLGIGPGPSFPVVAFALGSAFLTSTSPILLPRCSFSSCLLCRL